MQKNSQRFISRIQVAEDNKEKLEDDKGKETKRINMSWIIKYKIMQNMENILSCCIKSLEDN